MPKKPDRPFATIVFSADGKVRPNIEHTNLSQADLEHKVVVKFAATLRDRGIDTLSDVRMTDEEPIDCDATRSDGSVVKIQVTEIVDEASRQLWEKRRKLVQVIQSDQRIIDRYQGCRVKVVTAHDNSHRPIAFDDIVSQVASIGSELSTLSIGTARLWKLDCNGKSLPCSILVERVANAGPPNISCPPGSRALPESNWMKKTIQKKVERRGQPPQDEFWLLAYSSDVLAHEDEQVIKETVDYLDSTQHFFDQVWYFYPLPNTSGGQVTRIWPKAD